MEKKISLTINENVLKIIDEIANLSKNNKESIINAVLAQGIFSYLKFLEMTWKRYLDEEEDERVKKEIKRLLQGLKNIREENPWLNSDFYLKNLSSEKGMDEKTKKRIIHVLQDMDLIPKDKF